MIYGFYTKFLDKTEEIKVYVKEKYSEDIVEVTNINWGNGSDQSQFYTFFDIASTDFDVQLATKDLKIAIIKLENGNNFYNQEIAYIPAIDDYIPIIENVINSKVKEYKYDSIVTATSYTNSDNLTFRKESLAFVKWRDQLWGPVLDQLKLDLANGTPPDLDTFLANLPTYESVLATITV